MATRIYSLAIASNVGGQFATNVLHYQFDDGGFASTFAAAKALIDAWDAHATAHLQAIIPGHTTLLSLKSRLVSGVGGFEALNLYPAGTVGSRTGDLEVAGIGPCLIFYQANNGKKRGKMFLPGVTVLDLINGQFSGAYQNAVLTHQSFLVDNLTLTGGGGPTANAVIYTRSTKTGVSIFGIALSPMAATQRRRQLPF